MGTSSARVLGWKQDQSPRDALCCHRVRFSGMNGIRWRRNSPSCTRQSEALGLPSLIFRNTPSNTQPVQLTKGVIQFFRTVLLYFKIVILDT